MVNQAIGGIWNSGTVNTPSVMLITETGELSYVGFPVGLPEGFLGFIGNLSVNGNVVTGAAPESVVLLSPNECPWDVCYAATNSEYAYGALTGTISERSTMTLDGVVWTYNALYNQPSSLAKTAGNWNGQYMFGPNVPFNVVNIDASGVVSAADPYSACTLSGQVSLIDPSYNAYNLTVTYAPNCIQGDGFQNEVAGLTGTGIAYIDSSASPSVLQITILFANPGGTPLIGGFSLYQQAP